MRSARRYRLVLPWMMAAALAGLCTGCASLRAMAAGRPTASVASVEVGRWAMDGATVDIDLEIDNPYTLPMPLTSVEYRMRQGEQLFASGRSTLTGVVPAHGQRRVRVELDVNFIDARRVLTGIEPGSVIHWNAAMEVAVDAPGAGTMKLPLKATGDLQLPAAPAVKLGAVKWTGHAPDRVTGTLTMELRNTNPFEVTVRHVWCDVLRDGKPVTGGDTDDAITLKPRGAAEVELPVSAPAPETTAVLNRQGGYELRGVVEMTTPFGDLRCGFRSESEPPPTQSVSR